MKHFSTSKVSVTPMIIANDMRMPLTDTHRQFVRQLVLGAAKRREPVICFDPVVDHDLRSAVFAASLEANIEPLYFNPAQPDESIRLDLLRKGEDPSVLSRKVCSLVDPLGSSPVFTGFTHMILTTVFQGMLLVDVRPTLESLARNLEDFESLFIAVMTDHCDQLFIPNWRDGLAHYRAATVKELNRVHGGNLSERLATNEALAKQIESSALAKFYDSRINGTRVDSRELRNLCSIAEHPSEHRIRMMSYFMNMLLSLLDERYRSVLSMAGNADGRQPNESSFPNVIDQCNTLYIGLDTSFDPLALNALGRMIVADMGLVMGDITRYWSISTFMEVRAPLPMFGMRDMEAA